jgi:hypothetical protein
VVKDFRCDRAIDENKRHVARPGWSAGIVIFGRCSTAFRTRTIISSP